VAGAWSGVERSCSDGPCELGEDRSAAFERLHRGQRVPVSAVSGDRADLRTVRGRFHPFYSVKLIAVPVPEKGFFSGTQAT